MTPLGLAPGLPVGQSADLAIAGGGPAGATAAMYAARAGIDVLVIDRGITAGSLGQAHLVANYPGLEPLPGAEIVEMLRRQAEGFGARFLHAQILGAAAAGDGVRVDTSEGPVTARSLIVATGATARGAALPGEEEHVGHGVSYCATCDGAFFAGRPVAVAGRTDEAAQEAMHLARLASRVEVLVPGDLPTEPVWGALAAEPNVRLHPRHSVKAVESEDGAVRGVRVRGPEGERALAVAAVFLYLQGRRPDTAWLGDLVDVPADGCLTVGAAYETAVPGVYAVGDVLCTNVQQAVVAAAQGAAAAMHVERRLRGWRAARPDWR